MDTTMDKNLPYTVSYTCRQLDPRDEPESGVMDAVWTGEVDPWGKYTFRPLDGSAPRYLFADEFTVEDLDDAPSDSQGEPFDPLSTHTPSPWETGAGDCHTVYAVKRDGYRRIVARCPCQDGKRDYDSHESFKNAQLIAAAPELVDALRRLLGQLDHAVGPREADLRPVRQLLARIDGKAGA